ncbi:hypothetical protein LCGC14_1437470 [marine sediment metagenome]|uniref:Major facilitator superfamily (MFS) profile domain-containing protein n=1 Tax=marine sediment metagenome TaxID=412755 RepID=A0A0F9K7X3_9ZZZZ
MKSSKTPLDTVETKEYNIGKMLMFSMGYFLNGFMLVAFNNYVWHYYEGELGLISLVSLWPLYMFIANVIFTIWSMLINPILGYLTDKPTKWTKKIGFHTPWIIIGGIPAIILFFLFFTPPAITGIESVIPILIYYLIIVCLYDLFYSLYQAHSFGAFPAHFRGDIVRRKAGTMTQIFIFLANFLTITMWSLIIIPGNPRSFTIAAFVSLILMGISLAFFIPGSKESEEIKDRFILGYNTAEKTPFIKTMKMAVKQKNFMIALFTYIAFMVALGLTSMNAINFVDDVLQESQDIRSIGSFFYITSSLLTIPLWVRLAKKIGHSKTYSIGLLCFGLSLLLNLFISNAFEFYIINILNGVTGAMFLIMLSPVLADCYDEITVKTNKHHEATLIGIRNFFLRFSLTFQTLIVAIIHLLTVYNPNNLIHGKEALIGLRMIQGFFPSVICILAALIFYKWFDLKGKKKQVKKAMNLEIGIFKCSAKWSVLK